MFVSVSADLCTDTWCPVALINVMTTNNNKHFTFVSVNAICALIRGPHTNKSNNYY
jgi:hypothetical protein